MLQQNDSRILALLRKQGYCFVSDDDAVFPHENGAINYQRQHGHAYTRYPEAQPDMAQMFMELKSLRKRVTELEEDRDTTEAIFDSMEKVGKLRKK